MADISCVGSGKNMEREVKTGYLARLVEEGREEDVVEYLASADRNTQHWQTDLDKCVMIAIQRKQPGIMKRLIEAGADIDQSDKYKLNHRTALEDVFSSGDSTMLDIFLEHFKGDLREHIGASRGIYLLCSAVESRNLQSVKRAWSLLQELDIELSTESCLISPIHSLVDFHPDSSHDASSLTTKLEEVLDFLIETGYDINYNEENTPLHLAVQNGNIAGIRALLKHGARLFVQDFWGDYPWTHACNEKHYEVLQELLQDVALGEHQEVFESLLHPVCRLGWEPGIRYLLDKGVDVNCTDDRNRTPLIIAVENEFTNVVQCLTNHRLCDVNFDNEAAMRSAWMSVCKNEGKFCEDVERIIECLVQAGASFELPDMKGHTLLMDGYMLRTKVYLDCLLRYGADVNAVSEDGRSVLWTAVCYEDSGGHAMWQMPALEQYPHLSILTDLLAHNIDVGVSQHQHKGRTPLQDAFHRRKHELCNILLDADCSLYGMRKYLSTIQEHEKIMRNDTMENVRTRILEMCDEPYSLKAQARLAVLRTIGQGDLRANLCRINCSRLLPKELVNYLGKTIALDVDRM